MEEQQINSIKDDLRGLDKSEYTCPCCGGDLYIYPEGTSPDDYTTALICPACFYWEQE
jgi:hypothetical protein